MTIHKKPRASKPAAFFCTRSNLAHLLAVHSAHPTKGGDYEIEDLDKASGLAVVCDHARSLYLLSAELFTPTIQSSRASDVSGGGSFFTTAPSSITSKPMARVIKMSSCLPGRAA